MTVISWAGLVAALGFALAGLSVQHLSAMTVHSNRQEAQNLARSAVSKAIERLLTDADFCKTPPDGQILKIELQGTRPGAVGLLSFHPSTARDNQISYSVNNLQGTRAVDGGLGRPVAPAQAQLIGEGRCGGMTRRVVAVLAIPPFPYAIASAGPVSAQGGLTLGALEAVPEEDVPADIPLDPADLMSNSPGSQAIFLGANTRVSGDVKAAGGIELDPTAPEGSIRVEGAIRSNSSPVALPKIPLSDYDPQGSSSRPFTPLNSEVYSAALRVAGVMRRQGGLRADYGLSLDGGLLFVDGDLTVRGGLTGQGVVVCTGKVTLDGQSRMVSGNGVALLAGKDISVTGQASEESYFQGLVYTEGTFQANRVTIVGTLIAAGRDDQPVTLVQSRLLQPPERSVSVRLPAPPTTSTTSGGTRTAVYENFTTPGGVLEILPRVSRTSVSLTGGMRGGRRFAVVVPIRPGMGVLEFTTLMQSAISRALGGQRMPPGGIMFHFSEQILADAAREPEVEVPGETPIDEAVVVTVDPSTFMRIQDRVRVVLWKEEHD